MTFLGRKECVGAPQWPLDYVTTLNTWDLVGCLEHDSLHCHPQLLHTIDFGFVTPLILDCQAHVFLNIF